MTSLIIKIGNITLDNCFPIEQMDNHPFLTIAQTVAYLSEDHGISVNWYGVRVEESDMRNYSDICSHPLLTVGKPNETSEVSFIYYEDDASGDIWVRYVRRFK